MITETNPKDFIWAQAYRPNKVEDCILPSSVKKMVIGMVSEGEIPHMLFVGGPGMGKTTLAYAIAKELGSDILYINASMERGIDILRTKILSFASSMSLSDTGPKIVILDEADGSTPDFQAGLKGFLETFSANCRFIFTANNKHKIIDPILSRSTVIDFTLDSAEKPKVAAQFYRRVIDILDLKEIEYEQKVVAKLVEKNFPDFRKTLNELQRFSSYGKIDSDVLLDHTGDTLKVLFKYLKERDFYAARTWVAKNEDIDTSIIFRAIYDHALENMNKKTFPQLVLILAEYGYKSSFCADLQINTMACIAEIMSSCEWN